MKPDFFLFENVKGLWRTKRHREFFDELKGMLNKAGHITTERLTNALEYGAPQDRDRILMFGIQKDVLSALYPDKAIDDFPWAKYQKHKLSEIKELPWPSTDSYVENHPNANDYFTPKAGKAKMEIERNLIGIELNSISGNAATFSISEVDYTNENIVLSVQEKEGHGHLKGLKGSGKKCITDLQLMSR